jgi:hypothetical protein
MTAEVAIQGDKHYAFSSDPDREVIAHLEQMAGNGLNASGFRTARGVILLVGDSLRTVIVEACEVEN